jgi:hypothetical protein
MNVHQKIGFLVRVQAMCTKKVDFSDMTSTSCSKKHIFCGLKKGVL